jgi:hypothetical protein
MKPVGIRVSVELGQGMVAARLSTRPQDEWRDVDAPGLSAAAGRVLELRIPFGPVGLRTADPVAFFIVLSRGTVEIEHFPRHLPIEFEVPDRTFAARNWTA